MKLFRSDLIALVAGATAASLANDPAWRAASVSGLFRALAQHYQLRAFAERERRRFLEVFPVPREELSP